MNQNEKKIITARAIIPVNTAESNPLIVRLSSQFPILERVGIYFILPAAGVDAQETGWKVCAAGGQTIIPSMGSFDESTRRVYVGGYPFRYEIYPFVELDGPPFEFELHLYNRDASVWSWAFFDFTFGNKILLPSAPIVSDLKKE